MKAVILAGGLGTRLSEETEHRPKPMVEIGGKPILWHIMKIYSAHGIDDFIICLGYKGYVIKEWFANYFLHNSDVTFDMRDNSMSHPPGLGRAVAGDADRHRRGDDDRRPHQAHPALCRRRSGLLPDLWRRRRRRRHLARRSRCTRDEGRLATVTATQPPGRFGSLRLDGNRVTGFQEKPIGDGGWINGGFFVLSPKVGDYIDGDASVWEREPMERLAADDQLSVYFHHGFWQPMDTLRDKRYLEELWGGGTSAMENLVTANR